MALNRRPQYFVVISSSHLFSIKLALICIFTNRCSLTHVRMQQWLAYKLVVTVCRMCREESSSIHLSDRRSEDYRLDICLKICIYSWRHNLIVYYDVMSHTHGRVQCVNTRSFARSIPYNHEYPSEIVLFDSTLIMYHNTHDTHSNISHNNQLLYLLSHCTNSLTMMDWRFNKSF